VELREVVEAVRGGGGLSIKPKKEDLTSSFPAAVFSNGGGMRGGAKDVLPTLMVEALEVRGRFRRVLGCAEE